MAIVRTASTDIVKNRYKDGFKLDVIHNFIFESRLKIAELIGNKVPHPVNEIGRGNATGLSTGLSILSEFHFLIK